MFEWIRFCISAVFIIAGLLISLTAVFGLHRFRFVLNRMHAAATNDTLGILLILIGLMIQNGFQLSTLKFLLIILFFWFASPVAGHLIAKMQVTIDKNEAEGASVDEYEIIKNNYNTTSSDLNERQDVK